MEIINVGIIGYGLSGRYLQAPFFDSFSGFHLEAIMTKNGDPKKDFPNVTHYLDVDGIIRNDNIQLISICSPNLTHFEYVKKCLEAGKHVLVEKPLVASLRQAQILYDLAESKGLQLFVFQNRRFDSDFLTVKKLIEAKMLGRLLSLDINFHRHKPDLNPKKWKESNDPSTGIMYDLGSHILDQAIALFGRPKSWYGQVFTQRDHSEIDDAFLIWLDYDDIKVCLRSSMLVSIEQPRYVLIGTEGMAIKYGIDVQEDHLKEGIAVTSPSFGVEEVKNAMTLKTSQADSKIAAEKGNWMNFFIEIYEAIVDNKAPSITREQILLQIEILDSIKNKS